MNNNFEIVKELLKTNGEVTSVTSGNSMRPLFRDRRDYATIVPCGNTYRKNDVLLYKDSSDRLVLHRIIKAEGSTLILRGDGLYRNETNVKAEDIIGVMKAFCRKGKTVECKKSLLYKLYVLYIRLSYPIRYCLYKGYRLFKKIFSK